MTSDTPSPSPDTPDSTTEPSQPLATGLLTTTTLPATTAAAAATGPKIPPFVAD
jgi:hypothetical protein